MKSALFSSCYTIESLVDNLDCILNSYQKSIVLDTLIWECGDYTNISKNQYENALEEIGKFVVNCKSSESKMYNGVKEISFKNKFVSGKIRCSENSLGMKRIEIEY